MAKIVLICGKICSGKTNYSRQLAKKINSISLSSDELISVLFHPNENDYHDKIIKNVHKYLMNKSVEIIKTGVNVILDWGFWTHADRIYTTDFYRKNGIDIEWHYINICGENWAKNIKKRNYDVINGKTTDYYVDKGLLDKLESMFEIPCRDEIDVWIDV